jgi:hypothetical protein
MTAFGAIPEPDQTALRTGPQAAQSYLTVVPPTPMMTARINQAAFTYPLAQITIDSIVLAGGLALANIPPNVDVWIGTTAGARDVFVGRTRLDNSGDVVTATTLYVEEISAGMSNIPQVAYAELANDQYITIVETESLYYALPNIVDIGGVFTTYQDWNIVYTNQNEEPRPVANITFLDGTRPVGFVGDGGTYRVTLSGETSFQAITGAAPASYLWNIQDGALVGGYALSDETVEVDFAQGSRWVELTVTDANAHTHTARFPLVYYDADNMPYRVFATNDVRNRKGRTMTVEGYPDALTLQDVPHRAMCIVWEEGIPESEYTIDWFVGFAVRERAGLVEHLSSLEIVGPVPFLDRVQSVSTRFESAAENYDWWKGIPAYVNIPGAIHWLLYWNLPALLAVFNVRFFPDSSETWGRTINPGFGSGSLGAGTVGQQLAYIAGRLPAFWGSTSDGSVVLVRDPQYLADRSEVVTRATLTLAGDLEDLSFTREHVEDVGQVYASGTIYRVGAGVVATQAYAPGTTPAQGSGRPSLTGMQVSTPAEIDYLAGAHFAVLNNPFDIQATALFPDVWEPCLGYRLALTIAGEDFDRADYGAQLRRLYDIPTDAAQSDTTRNFYVAEVQVEREGTYKRVRLRLEPEITAVAGVNVPIQQATALAGIGAASYDLSSVLLPVDISIPDGAISTFAIDPLTFPPLAPPIPQPPVVGPQEVFYESPEIVNGWPRFIFALGSAGYVTRLSPEPGVAAVHTTIRTSASTSLDSGDLAYDAWNDRLLIAWPGDGLEECKNYLAATPAWTQIYDIAGEGFDDTVAKIYVDSHVRDRLFMITHTGGGTGTSKLLISTDGGETFIESGLFGVGMYVTDVATHPSGRIHVVGANVGFPIANIEHHYFAFSDDDGATWDITTKPNKIPGDLAGSNPLLLVPANDKAGAPNDGTLWYMAGGNEIGVLVTYQYISVTEDDGDNFDDVTPGSELIPNATGWNLYRFPDGLVDPTQPWMLIGTKAGFPPSQATGSAILNNGDDTYSTKATPGDAGYPGGGQGIQLFQYNPAWWLVWGGQSLFATQMITVTADNGDTWENFLGDFFAKSNNSSLVRKVLVYPRGYEEYD